MCLCVNCEKSLYWFPRVAVTKSHKLGDFSNRHFFSHSPGGWEFEIKVSRVMLPRKAPGKDVFQAQLLEVPWHVAAQLQSSHGITPVCMSVSKCPLFIKASLILHEGPALLQCDVCNNVTPNKVTFQGTEG